MFLSWFVSVICNRVYKWCFSHVSYRFVHKLFLLRVVFLCLLCLSSNIDKVQLTKLRSGYYPDLTRKPGVDRSAQQCPVSPYFTGSKTRYCMWSLEHWWRLPSHSLWKESELAIPSPVHSCQHTPLSLCSWSWFGSLLCCFDRMELVSCYVYDFNIMIS